MKIPSHWRGAGLGFLVLGAAGLVVLFGAGALGLHGPAVARQWMAAAHGPFGLPVAIGCFAVLAFLGVPQFALIAAAVAVFGPWLGGAYSWIGTLVSAVIGFCIGRVWGRRIPGLAGQGPGGRFMAMVSRNGFLASLVIRLAPFAPFVVVNLAAGATAIGSIDFVAGTALGILPKIVLTALAGRSVEQALGGAGALVTTGLIILAGAVWILAGLAARRWMKP